MSAYRMAEEDYGPRKHERILILLCTRRSGNDINAARTQRSHMVLYAIVRATEKGK